jgi:hypothetical protein
MTMRLQNRGGSLAGMVAAVGLAAASAMGQVSVVSPAGFEFVEGANNNSWPFTPGTSLSSQRYQQVHWANDFTAISGPHRITEIRFRLNATTSNLPFVQTVDHLLLRFSTTPAMPDQLSTVFASNVGPDETVVYSGAAMYSSASTAAPPGPMPFDISIVFQNPFTYDPAQGNLLMDVIREGGPISRTFDAHTATGDGVSRMCTNGTVPSSSPTATTSSSLGLVVMFIMEPVSGVCYANCDGSTNPPILNVADFGCFLTKFAAGDPYANCDGSTTPPVLNVADFGCFLTAFAAGCR